MRKNYRKIKYTSKFFHMIYLPKLFQAKPAPVANGKANGKKEESSSEESRFVNFHDTYFFTLSNVNIIYVRPRGPLKSMIS